MGALAAINLLRRLRFGYAPTRPDAGESDRSPPDATLFPLRPGSSSLSVVASSGHPTGGTCVTSTVIVHGAWSVLNGGSLRFTGNDGVPPLVLGDGVRITFCAGPYGQPCQEDQVYERR